jgi:membrane protease YdiL (CAAX protease family)
VTFALPAADGLPPFSTPPQPALKPIARWRWWIHLVLIGAYPVLIASLSWGRAAVRGPALSHSVRGLLIVCGLELLLFSIVFGLGWLASRASRDALLWRWRPGYWVVPLGIGYSVAIRVAVGVAVAVVSAVLLAAQVVTVDSLQQFMVANRPDVETLVDVSAMRSSPLYFWLTMTLVSFVVAGLREEMWRSATLAAMRALWPQAFGSRWRQILAVALIAVVFGAAHAGMGVIAAGVAGLLGFFLGIIMVLHRSIWPAVIAHGLFDATSMALLPWAMEKIQQLR